MVIHNLHIMGVVVTPCETDTPLVINPDAVLAGAVVPERFKAVARWRAQILKLSRAVQNIKLSGGKPLDCLRQFCGKSAVEQLFGFPAGKCAIMAEVLTYSVINIKHHEEN